MIGSLIQPDLELLIKEKDWNALREVLSGMDGPDIAELMIDLPPEDEGVIFRLLPRERAAVVFSYLPLDRQQEAVQSLSNAQVHSILTAMTPDDRTRLLEELPAEVTRKLLETLSPDELKVARQLLGYPEGTAGRYMTPKYVALPPDMTARDALEHVRRTGRGKETLSILYVTEPSTGKLLEDVRLGSLVLADPDMKVADVEDRPLVTVPATASGADVVNAFEKYGRTALPVVDGGGHMLGIITVDDVLESAEKRAPQEMKKRGGSEALAAPYTQVSFGHMPRKRGGWLAALFLGEPLPATAM